MSTVFDFSSLTAADGTYSIPLQAMNDSANNYGGTVIISVMASFGIMLSFYANRDRELKK